MLLIGAYIDDHIDELEFVKQTKASSNRNQQEIRRGLP